MFMCHIGGWEETFGFAETEEKAVRIAMKRWKEKCAPDVKNWTRKQIDEYCGLTVIYIESKGFYYDSYGSGKA